MLFVKDITVIEILICFAIAFIVAFASTPFVIKLAFKVGAVDEPVGGRHIHRKTTPLIGGLAIFLGFVTSLLVFSGYIKSGLSLVGMLAGSILIVAMGIVDDARDLSAKIKLLFQIIAAVIVVSCGITVNFVSVPEFVAEGFPLPLEWLKYPITIVWIVGVTNAVNLIDGLDGLAAGVSSIATFSLFFISVIQGNVEAAVISASLAGSCMGFLPFNFNPAKIFMGDTGSQFLGFMLAIISVLGLSKQAVAISFIVPFLILGLPIFDTSFAILRRIIQKRPIMEADRGHLHHRLLDKGFSQKQTVAILYIISIMLSIVAVLVAKTGAEQFVWIALSIIIVAITSIALSRKIKKNNSADECSNNNSNNKRTNQKKKGENK